jgi:hypothetical protein
VGGISRLQVRPSAADGEDGGAVEDTDPLLTVVDGRFRVGRGVEGELQCLDPGERAGQCGDGAAAGGV